MSITTNPLTVSALGDTADVFLYVKTKRAGVIKGESQAPAHLDEIVLRGWRWGVNASSAIGHVAATSRRSYTGLTVYKTIDMATTPLMAALATNDEVTEARLSMHRAGGEQELYFSIVLKGARVSGLEHETDATGTTTETVTMMFTKVEVEYRPQKTTGQRSGSFTFTDELSSNA